MPHRKRGSHAICENWATVVHGPQLAIQEEKTELLPYYYNYYYQYYYNYYSIYQIQYTYTMEFGCSCKRHWSKARNDEKYTESSMHKKQKMNQRGKTSQNTWEKLTFQGSKTNRRKLKLTSPLLRRVFSTLLLQMILLWIWIYKDEIPRYLYIQWHTRIASLRQEPTASMSANLMLATYNSALTMKSIRRRPIKRLQSDNTSTWTMQQNYV